MERNEGLVSFDARNLCASIPIDKALKLVENFLKESKTFKIVTDMSV